MRHLDEIVARAEPLWARLKRPPPAEWDPALGAERLERWRRLAAGGDSSGFEKRLAWSGWRSEEVERVLGAASEPGGPRPGWAATVEAMSRAARTGGGTWSPGADDVPFEPLFCPMARVAEERISGGAGWSLLSPEARFSLMRSLVARMAEISAAALYTEFVKELPKGPDLVSVLLGPPRTPATVRFDAFVRRHIADGYEDLFTSYPVLARLLATALDDWAAAASEFLARLATDREALGIGSVARLRPGLSEPHNGGRSVIVAETDAGRRVVYKARSVDGEAAFARVVGWFNGQAPEGWLPLLAAPVTLRDGYGWMDFVEAAECRDAGEAGRCFERVGELLGLLHALQATDVNRENLILQGEQPVLIDAETLLQPDAVPLELPEPGTERWAGISREFGRSVVRTGLLPAWEVHPSGETAYDLGGLGGAEPERSPLRGPRFHNRNTDSMVLVNDFAEMAPDLNVVRMNGRPLPAADFADRIVAGFERACQLVAGERSAFLGALAGDAPRRPLKLRYVYRATRVYYAVLLAARSPEKLGDGVEFSLELDRLGRAFLRPSDRPPAFGMLAAELEALERGDVPYFAMESTGRALESGERVIEGILAESAEGRVEESLSTLDGKDGLRQAHVVRGVLDAGGAHGPGSGGATLPGPGAASPAAETDLIRAAEAIAAEIRRSAVRSSSGPRGLHAYWTGMVPLGRSERYGFGPLGDDLYQGSSGIALFLAALAAVTGTAEDAELVEEAISFSRTGWKDLAGTSRERWLGAMGDGAASGVPSLVYALLRSGTLLGRRDLVESAADLAGVLESDVVFESPHADVVGGHAGAILVLLRLREEMGEAGLLRAAIRRGERLLELRDGTDGGPRAWLFDGKRLAGFGHGAAGISHSLLRLFEATSDERFLEAGREGMAYEDSLFDPGAGNWRDLRDPKRREGPRTFMTAWCHGAAGIGMARLASLPIDGPGRRAEAEAALGTTIAHPLDDVDHLCCGNFGRLDFLWTAAQTWGRKDLAEQTRRTAAWLLGRAEAGGGFRLAGRPVAASSAPSLFRGAAGIGYQLLRLAAPSKVPSVLLFE